MKATLNPEHASVIALPDKNYIAHNAAYEAIGLKAVYLAYMTENFAPFLEAARQHQFAGFSVTMPFKVCLVTTISTRIVNLKP